MTTELFDKTISREVFGLGEARLGLLKYIITILEDVPGVKDDTPQADYRFVRDFMIKLVPNSAYPEGFAYLTTLSMAERNQIAMGATAIYEHYRVDQSTEEYPQTPVRMLDLFSRVHPEEREMQGMLQEYAMEP